MKYESEAEIIDKIAFDTFHDARGPITLRASLTFYSRVALDPWMLYNANINVVAAEKDSLRRLIVSHVHTVELEAELQRLRKIEHECFSCPKQIPLGRIM